MPLAADRWFVKAEIILSAFAGRKSAIAFAFFATILLRVALLPIFPVPVPAIHDEFADLVQADMFAHGHLAYPPHPLATYFDSFYVNFHPVYASMFPPAQGAVLAIGQWLGNPWIGVLLSCGAMSAAILWMLQAWFPSRWAFLATALFTFRIAIFGYWMNSFWGGAVPAIGAALVMGALPRIKAYARTRDALWMGLGILLLANSRPLEGFIFCLPVAIVVAAWLWQRFRSGHFPLESVVIPLSASLLLLLAFTLYYNRRLTGNALELPHARFIKDYMSVRLFLWQKPLPAKHFSNPQFQELFGLWVFEQFNGTIAAIKHVTQLKFVDFYHYFLGEFLVIPLLAFPCILKDRRVRLLLIQFLVCAAGIFSVVWFLPHYAAPLLIAFIGLWLQCFRHLRQWKIGDYALGVVLSRIVVVGALASVLVCAHQVMYERYEKQMCDKWQPHNLERAGLVRQLEQMPGEHLVIVRYSEDHNIHMEWVYNRADIDAAKIVWAREIPGVDLAPLFAYYPHRKVWVVTADSEPPTLVPYTGQPPSAPAQDSSVPPQPL